MKGTKKGVRNKKAPKVYKSFLHPCGSPCVCRLLESRVSAACGVRVSQPKKPKGNGVRLDSIDHTSETHHQRQVTHNTTRGENKGCEGAYTC